MKKTIKYIIHFFPPLLLYEKKEKTCYFERAKLKKEAFRISQQSKKKNNEKKRNELE